MTAALHDPVLSLINAVNSGDLPRFLALFTPDGVVDDWGREFRGAGIESWSDAEFLGKNVTLEVTEVEFDGAEVSVRAQVGGDGFNGPSTFRFTVDGDRVSAMTIRA